MNHFLTLCVCLSAASIVSAGEVAAPAKTTAAKKENFQKDVPLTSPKIEAMKALTLAQDLADYGTATKNPTALIVAASILLDHPVKNDTAKKEVSGTDKAAAEVPKTTGKKQVALDPAILIASAEEIGKGNEPVTKLAEQAKQRLGQKSKALVGTGKLFETKVSANTSDTYIWSFKGQETAAIALKGDGDTDLDLYVYDENGNEVCRDVKSSDECSVTWTPAWTGKFVVKVKNLGNVYNKYAILVP